MRNLFIRIRQHLAIRGAWLAHTAIRRLHRGSGTTLPGAVAGRIDPHLLSRLAASVRQKTFAVMGTNGKTTTNNLLCRCLEQEGHTVICNRMGANMKSGILTAFVLAAAEGSLPDADYACLEVDEFSAPEVLPKLHPDCILLTNLFRDQLDRYGEIDLVRQRLLDAILLVPDATLVINCDDLFSCAIARSCPNPVLFYGIDEPAFLHETPDGPKDCLFCPTCGSRLSYDFFHYGHLGLWHCPVCGLRRPAPDCAAAEIRFQQDSCSFYLDGHPFRIRTAAACHVYNTLAVYAALQAVRASCPHLAGTVSRFDYGNHREEVFLIGETRVQLYLAKNPVGLQQKLALMARDPAPKDILFQIHDREPDGRDVSWLWDVNFSGFAGLRADTVLTAGLRRYDMELRLKYEDIPCQVSEDTEADIRRLIRTGTRNLYIITNYSGLYRMNDFLHALETREEIP